MSGRKTVGDLMRETGSLPTIAVDASLGEAAQVLLGFLEATAAARPTLAVMDGNRLVGVVTQRDLLLALEPEYLKRPRHAEGALSNDSELALIWERQFGAQAREQLARPVSSAMRPVKVSVKRADSVVKACCLMINEDLPILPVMDGGRLVGVLRMRETFAELMQRMIAEA